MVLCLMNLTDLQTRRAGLSPSAELLVSCRYAGHLPVCTAKTSQKWELLLSLNKMAVGNYRDRKSSFARSLLLPLMQTPTLL